MSLFFILGVFLVRLNILSSLSLFLYFYEFDISSGNTNLTIKWPTTHPTTISSSRQQNHSVMNVRIMKDSFLHILSPSDRRFGSASSVLIAEKSGRLSQIISSIIRSVMIISKSLISQKDLSPPSKEVVLLIVESVLSTRIIRVWHSSM